MPDSRKFLHPEALRRIARLEVRARHVVEGFLSGMHRSPYFGQSVEFVQHRQYAWGDDPRHVDWKVWARQDRLVVKQYEEETNLRCTLLVDVSNSMRYGRGAMTKYDYAASVAASLAWLMLRQQDAVGCVTFDQAVRSIVPLRSKHNHLDAVVQALTQGEPADKTDVFPIFRRVAETYPRRGLMVLVSDLLAPRDSLLRGLRMLRQRGHDVLLFHVMDDDELEFPFTGPTRFEGLELPERLTCNPRALRQGYLDALAAFMEEIRRICAQNSIDYLLVRTSEPLDAVLAKFLSRRMAMLARHS